MFSTVDANGQVNSALFARPHVMEDGTVAFIMTNRTSRKNLTTNPHAAYLFKEDGKGYHGVRLSLTKLREEVDTKLLHRLRRRTYSAEEERQTKPLYLVFFTVDADRPLVGASYD